MSRMRISEELESLFLVKDYQWSIDGVLRYPTAEEIQETIDKAVERLHNEPSGTQVQVGRFLIVKKDEDEINIYAMIGPADDKSI